MIQADINYPDYFPQPLLVTNQRQRGQTFERSNADTGLATQRAGFSFQPVKMDFSIVWSGVGAWLFENFFKSGLNDGMKWFNLKRKTPSGYKWVTCRFTEMYKSSALSNGAFSFTCKIEVFSND